MTAALNQLRTAGEWFSLDRVGDGLYRVTEPHVHELIRSNAFLLKGRDRDLLVDSGLGISSLRAFLEDAGLLADEVLAVATHSHYDHVGSMHEFDDRAIHQAEAGDMAEASDGGTLLSTDFSPEFRDISAKLGLPLPDLLITALPSQEFDPRAYRLQPTPPTRTLVEGDLVETGDRAFWVLHLPGHSPGQIGLWEERTGILFSGDAIYDGPLLDEGMPGTDIEAYVQTMRRLREMSVSEVHAGHYASFDENRMIEIADAYLVRREQGAASEP